MPLKKWNYNQGREGSKIYKTVSKIKLIFYNHISNINVISDIFLRISFKEPDYSKFERIKIKKDLNMYRFIKYHFYSSHEIFKLIYKIDNEEKI